MPRMDSREWDEMLNKKYASSEERWYFLYDDDEITGTKKNEYDATEGKNVLVITVSFNPETRVIENFSTLCHTAVSEINHFQQIIAYREIMVNEQKYYLKYLTDKITKDPEILAESHKKWEISEHKRELAKQIRLEQKKEEARTRLDKELEYAREINWKLRNGEIIPPTTEKVNECIQDILMAANQNKIKTAIDLTEQAIKCGIDAVVIRKRVCIDLVNQLVIALMTDQKSSTEIMVSLLAIKKIKEATDAFDLLQTKDRPAIGFCRINSKNDGRNLAFQKLIEILITVSGYHFVDFGEISVGQQWSELVREMGVPLALILNVGFREPLYGVLQDVKGFEEKYIQSQEGDRLLWSIPILLIGDYVCDDDAFLRLPNCNEVKELTSIITQIKHLICVEDR